MGLLKNRTFWKWASVVITILGLFLVSKFLPVGQWLQQFTQWIKGQGPVGYLVFAAGYVSGTVLLLPGALLTIASGIAFGILWGSVIALFSATVGAALAFLIARYALRGAVEKQAQKNARFKALDAAVGEQGWKVVALLRLSPLVPFSLSNYFYGLTRIKFLHYVVASLIGMMPGAFLYAYLGHLGEATLTGGRSRTTQEYIFLIIGLAATISVTAYLTWLARKTLKKNRD